MNKLEKSNYVSICIVQSLIGAISPNFTRVSFTLVENHVWILFELRTESADDTEEIEDAISEVQSLFAGKYSLTYEISYGARRELTSSRRCVFSVRDAFA